MILNIDTLLGILKRTVISCLIVIVFAMKGSAWVQAQSSASSIIPVLSLLLLDNGLTDVVDVATGNALSCALLSKGTIKCWGSNSYGQLGDGTTNQQLIAVKVKGINTATAIATGHTHSCARLSNGAVKCWETIDMVSSVMAPPVND